MDAVRELFYKPRVLLIGSGEEYGHIREGETPIKEDNYLRPGNIYAATKVCQNMIASIYTQAYDMQLMMVRAFNHIGPCQSPIFVISDFCKQVAEIEAGKKEPVMYEMLCVHMRFWYRAELQVRLTMSAADTLTRSGRFWI